MSPLQVFLLGVVGGSFGACTGALTGPVLTEHLKRHGIGLYPHNYRHDPSLGDWGREGFHTLRCERCGLVRDNAIGIRRRWCRRWAEEGT